MATQQSPFENEPEAYQPARTDNSVVETPSPFNAEVKKRRNTRALAAGAMVLVVLIAGLAVGGFVLKNYREKWSVDRAEKERRDREKMAMTRRGRDFSLAPKPGDEPAIPPQAAASLPVAAVPLKDTPSSHQQPASTPAKPPPVSPMMTGQGSISAGSGETQAVDQLARQKHERLTVQQFAERETVGKPATTTLQSAAAQLGDRSFVLARGSWIPCILETQLDTTVAGNTSCVIPEDVYSDDGKTLLIERGSKAMGVFGNSLKRGDKRIAVTWNRVKTTNGVVIDVESPATDGVGTTGASGYVDNHWLERIGAAVLLSLVEDAIQYAIAAEQNKGQQDSAQVNQATTNVYVPQNTAGQTRGLAEKLLDSTINIPPTLYKNRGDRIMIFVNRDLWFDSTYKLVEAHAR